MLPSEGGVLDAEDDASGDPEEDFLLFYVCCGNYFSESDFRIFERESGTASKF